MAVEKAPHLFCFGLGFTARVLARLLAGAGWRVSGTCRSPEKADLLAADGIEAYLFSSDRPLINAARLLENVSAVVVSIPPDQSGDPVLRHHISDLRAISALKWLGYLSTTGVYGDTGGALVNEDALTKPTSPRSERRVMAERDWLSLGRIYGIPVHIFRLAGIYGRGRSIIDQVRSGSARRIHKPGHVFSRIHVRDAAEVLRASIDQSDPGRIYNVCDDAPAEPSDVVAYACSLLNTPPPPPVPLEAAARDMSAMALSFWRDCRRVDNMRIKTELDVKLNYPDYRSGLSAILAEELKTMKRKPAEKP